MNNKTALSPLQHMEVIVDTLGLRECVDMLSRIAYIKANHIRDTWQDEGLAELWESDGKRLEKQVHKILNWKGSK